MEKLISKLREISDTKEILELGKPIQLSENAFLIFLTEEDGTLPEIISISFKDLYDKELEELDKMKFEIFHLLESILTLNFSEMTNADACSFFFHFDSNHAGRDPMLSIKITDYLS